MFLLYKIEENQITLTKPIFQIIEKSVLLKRPDCNALPKRVLFISNKDISDKTKKVKKPIIENRFIICLL